MGLPESVSCRSIEYYDLLGCVFAFDLIVSECSHYLTSALHVL